MTQESFKPNDAPVGLVSLCVVAYNEEEFIGGLFAAIVAQDYPHANIEVILIDGASTDATKSLMERFAEEDHGFCRVRVFDNPKRILPSGWNVALANSTGDAIIRIDAHAYIPPDFVRQSVATLEAGEDVCGGVRPVRLHQETPWGVTLLLAEQSAFGSSVATYRRDAKPSYVSSIFHGSYRREVFDRVGLFDERLIRTEDNEIHYRIRKAGYRIRLNPQIRSYQYVRSTFKGMIRQKKSNGYWVGRTLLISPFSLRAYHLLPMLALFGALVLLVLGFTVSWIPFAVCAGLYVGLAVLIALLAVIRSSKRNKTMLALPLVFILMHTVYGLGTAQGLFKGLFDLLFSRGKGSDAGTGTVAGNG
jgi:glycosyltransferase involved in cell wall biosynthesis